MSSPRLSHHPLVTGTYSYKAEGTWVKTLRTGMIGQISYAQRTGPLWPGNPPDPDNPGGTVTQTLLWIVCPPRPVNPSLSINAACSATREEVKRIRTPY